MPQATLHCEATSHTIALVAADCELVASATPCLFELLREYPEGANRQDPVSVQALAGNAREILEKLCRQAGVPPMSDLLFKDHPGKPKREIYDALNLYRNCFKHLGDTEETRQEDQQTLDQFDDSKNEYLLYIALRIMSASAKQCRFPCRCFRPGSVQAILSCLAPNTSLRHSSTYFLAFSKCRATNRSVELLLSLFGFPVTQGYSLTQRPSRSLLVIDETGLPKYRHQEW
jgi:hypothetical protein